jgi:hypothetical protein
VKVERPTTATLASFFGRVAVDRNGCWLWTGCKNGKGYGGFRSNGAHRFSYAWFVGPIADGLEVDHLCRVRHCVNPAHLEAVTGMVNRLRGTGYPYRFGRCRRGHDLSRVGLARNASDGEVFCRECRRIAQARYWLRKGMTLGPILAGALMRESLRLARHSRSPQAVAS